MPDITFTDVISVEVLSSNFSDDMVCLAARTSTAGADADPARTKGLINALMRDRHGTPFEHMNATFRVRAPLFVWREHHRHRSGWCVAGDTQIALRGGAGDVYATPKTIEQIWEHWHLGVSDTLGRRRLLPINRKVRIRTHDENTMLAQTGQVLDVMQTGVKSLVEITTESGKVLRCTPEHHVLTGDGWELAGDLGQSDWVYRAGKGKPDVENDIPPMLRRAIGVWVQTVRPKLIKPVDVCYLCYQQFGFDRLVLDHVVPVVKDLARALDITNLRPACEPCHRAKTNDEQKLARRWGSVMVARPDRVASVRSAGEGMTYDLSVDDPWHNYTANGLVVHNSYNEESGRYKVLDPVFYVPGPDRHLTQVGKAMEYKTEPGSPPQRHLVRGAIEAASEEAYGIYAELLGAGVMREVARMVLPVNIMSTCVVTCNARSLMHFLSLRQRHDDAHFPSKPMAEINTVADGYEMCLAGSAPLVHEAFVANGRVAP